MMLSYLVNLSMISNHSLTWEKTSFTPPAMEPSMLQIRTVHLDRFNYSVIRKEGVKWSSTQLVVLPPPLRFLGNWSESLLLLHQPLLLECKSSNLLLDCPGIIIALRVRYGGSSIDLQPV